MKRNTGITLNPLSQEGFEELANHQDLYCISIYLPNSFKSEDSFEHLVGRLYKKLESNNQLHQNQGLTYISLKEHLNQIEPIITNWLKSNSPQNISFFISQERIQAFILPLETPFRIYINDHFYVKPISQLHNTESNIRLLYLEKNRARLFNMNQLEIKRIGAFSMKSKKELKHIPNHKLDFYNGVKLFYNSIPRQKELTSVISGKGKLIDGFLKNTDLNFDEKLIFHPQTFQRNLLKIALQPLQNGLELEKQKKQLALAKSQKSRCKNIHDVSEIIKLSALGLVKTLFLSKNKDVYGDFDKENDFVIIQANGEGNTSLSNLAAINTIIHQGQVFLMDLQQMPNPKNKMHAIIN